jgi:hypothetical protein
MRLPFIKSGPLKRLTDLSDFFRFNALRIENPESFAVSRKISEIEDAFLAEFIEPLKSSLVSE